MSDLPELRPNQFGISCKTWNGESGVMKMVDEILYFTINENSVSMELYPKKPVIIINKDAIKMIFNRIEESKKYENSLNESRFPFELNQDSNATTAAADSNELNDLKDNGEVEAGKAAILSDHTELSAQPDKDGIF